MLKIKNTYMSRVWIENNVATVHKPGAVPGWQAFVRWLYGQDRYQAKQWLEANEVDTRSLRELKECYPEWKEWQELVNKKIKPSYADMTRKSLRA